MDRIKDLIEKLVKQQAAADGPESLLPTVHALYEELLTLTRKPSPAGSKKVAVVLPPKGGLTEKKITEPHIVKPAAAAVQQAPPAAAEAALPQSPYAPKPTPAADLSSAPQPSPGPAVVHEPAKPVKQNSYSLQKPHITELPKQEPLGEKSAAPELFHPHFNAVEETPTLLQHEPPAQTQKELHELISDVKESLNDKLKQDRPELAHVLKDTPIKDLRKAIGVNDKFLFVAELFRGDEAMYERSLKTINGFHILPEAEYWINRELKVKLGWNDNRDAVQHFYHLVRRRFS